MKTAGVFLAKSSGGYPSNLRTDYFARDCQKIYTGPKVFCLVRYRFLKVTEKNLISFDSNNASGVTKIPTDNECIKKSYIGDAQR